MNPTDGSFGMLQAVQKEIFPYLRKHCPGFIHAMTAKEIVALVSSKIQPDWIAISVDGSAFDST